MERSICIHGHFYQPPRENPWLEAVELQESAYPYHDWNERIAAECYTQNSRSRVLDDEGLIARLSNNYARMSFNFGPTLLSWMKEFTPEGYAAIIEADRESMARFSGHGAAMAQGYNHIIMPLANDRDRQTQVLWGIRDFESRFGRKPEGMWLPETAVNIATLEQLAEQGVAFTVLAPRQARRIRPKGEHHWTDVKGAVDPSRAYECRLPSGRSIALFFYDGPISQAVAFERLLHSGDGFTRRLTDAFDDARHWPQLAHIATDGETYGHHHRHGDMALAHALDRIESDHGVNLTIYGEFLEKHPPTHEVEIIDDSSWSCVHGVERWRSDCGCNSGGNHGWTQAWRAPLREALDWLRDSVAPAFEQAAGKLLKDPWAARDAYIDLVLDRSPESRAAFFEAHARANLDEQGVITALKLLELQRHAMLMYTSCGWFFDDLGGIETVQVIQYAGRVVQLAEDLLGQSFEDEFLSRLEKAHSNVHKRSGRQIYNSSVRPAFVDLRRVGAHYALSSLFADYGDTTRVYAFDIERKDVRRNTAGRARLEIGAVTITSRITLESGLFSYAALHLGEHVMSAGVRTHQGPERFAKMTTAVETAFCRADFTQVIREMDNAFGDSNFSLASLFRDEQHKVVREVIESTLAQVEGIYRQTYDQHAPLIRFLSGLDIPVPRRLLIPAEFVVNASVVEAIEADPPRLDGVGALIEEATQYSIPLEENTISFKLLDTIERCSRQMVEQTDDPDRLERLRDAVDLASRMPFEVDLWQAQNAFHDQLIPLRAQMVDRAASGDESARRWIDLFTDLGAKLRVRAPM